MKARDCWHVVEITPEGHVVVQNGMHPKVGRIDTTPWKFERHGEYRRGDSVSPASMARFFNALV